VVAPSVYAYSKADERRKPSVAPRMKKPGAIALCAVRGEQCPRGVPRAVGVQIVVLAKQRGRALRLAHVGQAVEVIIPVARQDAIGRELECLTNRWLARTLPSAPVTWYVSLIAGCLVLVAERLDRLVVAGGLRSGYVLELAILIDSFPIPHGFNALASIG
jgi:hypothetical protein